MLEQPVKVLEDGTIDDRYEFDTVDEIMYEADKVLMAPCEAGGKLLEARERYLYMETRAQGIAGFDYARMGAYGCKITGTGCTERDALTDFAEAGERLQDAEQKYKEEQEKCIELLRKCDRLTEEQRGALECRYCNDVKLTGYAVMSALRGFTGYKQAYYICQRGYENFAMWLHDKKVREEYQRCLANPPQYTSTLYCS